MMPCGGGSISVFVLSVLGQSLQWVRGAEEVAVVGEVARLRATRCDKRLGVLRSNFTTNLDVFENADRCKIRSGRERESREEGKKASAVLRLTFAGKRLAPSFTPHRCRIARQTQVDKPAHP